MGNITAAFIEDNETIFVNNNVIKNTDINIKNILQSIKSILDQATKILFPPLKSKKHGNICPITHIRHVKYFKKISIGKLFPIKLT